MLSAECWAPPASERDRTLPLLLVLFAGSGCAALIYEIVWFHFLQLIVGSTTVSLGVLLAAYMAGLCLGSIMLPNVVPERLHPLLVFALLETGTGILGLAIRFSVPYAGWLYLGAARLGLPGILPRALLAAVFLLPPTLLMGASLPAIARWTKSTPEGLSSLGLLYAGNIAGAVVGSLLSGFWLLRIYDAAFAIWAAAALNFAVAGIALLLARGSSYCAREEQPVQGNNVGTAAIAIYMAIAASGLCALGAEVVWTRLLSLSLGGTVYTFSIILAVFLAGLGLGSGAASQVTRARQARIALGLCQLLLCPAIVWTSWVLARPFPFFTGHDFRFAGHDLGGSWVRFPVDLFRCLWAIFPATFLWGASFPLALAAGSEPEEDCARLTARIYAWNTVGGIVGALMFSILAVPATGTLHSQQFLGGLSAVAGLTILIPLLRERFTSEQPATAMLPAGSLLLAICLCAVLIRHTRPTGWQVIAYGRRAAITDSPGTLLYAGEGINSSIAVTAHEGGSRYFHVAGKVEASTQQADMRLQRMLGHLPALAHRAPRAVLVVGFGAGVTAGAFTAYPDVEKITICEIEPLIPPVSARYFAAENYNVFHDPRTRIVYDDARHFIFTTQERFDIITSDPIHPWVRGASALYSEEYFRLVKSHLNPGGLVTQWVPLYQSDAETVKSEIATFFRVFPEGTIWGNDIGGEGYDIVLMGQTGPARIDLDAVDARLENPGYRAVVQSLDNVGFHGADDLLSKYAANGHDLAGWLARAQINRDLNLRLQYLAGMSLDLYDAAYIYSEILRYRNVPDDLFTGSAARIDATKRAISMAEAFDPD